LLASAPTAGTRRASPRSSCTPHDTTFSAAARHTDEVALRRDGQKAADLVRDRFEARGITF
jgi:hypothetical protein